MSRLGILVIANVSPRTALAVRDRLLWEQVRRFAAEGHTVRVVTGRSAGGVPPAIVATGISIRHVATDGPSRLGPVAGAIVATRRAVAEELASGAFDVVHLHEPLSGLATLSVGTARRLPSLYTFHRPEPPGHRGSGGVRSGVAGWAGAGWEALLWAIEGVCLRRAGRIHASSRSSVELLWDLYRVPSDRVVVERDVDGGRFGPAEDAVASPTWSPSVRAMTGELERLVAGAPPPAASPSCPACGGVMDASPLCHRGEWYRRCSGCATCARVSMPSRAELRARYDTEYPRRFPPDGIASARVAMLASVLDGIGAPAPAARLVDVGCAGGHLVAAARPRGWFAVGTDLSATACAATRAEAHAPAVQADATSLPFRDGAADAATLVNVVDHTLDPLAAVRETARVLRPGGVLAIRVPNARFHAVCARVLSRTGPLGRRRGWDRAPVLHLFAFGPRGLARLSERAGFEVLGIRNSPLVAGAPGDVVIPRALAQLTRAAVAVVSRVAVAASRGRWLVGPSIELYARKRP